MKLNVIEHLLALNDRDAHKLTLFIGIGKDDALEVIEAAVVLLQSIDESLRSISLRYKKNPGRIAAVKEFDP